MPLCASEWAVKAGARMRLILDCSPEEWQEFEQNNSPKWLHRGIEEGRWTGASSAFIVQAVIHRGVIITERAGQTIGLLWSRDLSGDLFTTEVVLPDWLQALAQCESRPVPE